MFTDSNMSKWVSVESRSELHIGWRSWPRNCETMEVIGTRRFEIQTTFVTSWTSERLGFGGHVELSKLTAFVVHTMVKCCCIQRKSFAIPWTATMACQGAKCPKQPVIELLQSFKRQTYSMHAQAEENHRCFSIPVAGCSGTQPRISRPGNVWRHRFSDSQPIQPSCAAHPMKAIATKPNP